MTSTIWAVCMAVALQAPPTQINASPASFVGTWVGVQTWASPGAPPSAKTPQQVTLNIELVDGKLVGTMPFFGGSDVATFVDTNIVGDELAASAVVKRAPAPEGADQRPARRAWRDDFTITFRFKADRVTLSATGEVLWGDVN